MVFNTQNQLKGKESSLITDVLFYFVCALLVAVVFCYVIFSFKSYLQSQKIAQMDNNISLAAAGQQMVSEKRALDYKKKIDEYSFIIGKHRISSNVFVFIEERTLPDVWFSNFDMSQSDDGIKLLGESENMEALSRQVQAFEKSEDYVSDVNISNLEVQASGKIRFFLSFHLNPKIFSYTAIPLPISANPLKNNQ